MDELNFDIYWFHALRMYIAEPVPEDWKASLEHLGDGVIDEELIIWQPFENYPPEEVFDLIENEAIYLRNNFISKVNA